MSLVYIPFLKMEGRSGCKLEVLTSDGIFSVKKISKEAAYNARLLRQADKQQDFYQFQQTTSFKAPEVIAKSAPLESPAWFEMPYLHGQKYSEYFERASVQDIKKLVRKFLDYFQSNFASSDVRRPDPKIFSSKLSDLRKLVPSNALAPLVSQGLLYLEQVPEAALPMKPCHGDFTFSNMVFCEDGIYLVDFLDSFIESPIIDLVKFRQDTAFNWSLLIESSLPESRASKIVQVFNYLDREVFGILQENPFVKIWYTYLQVFNLLRILPYVHHEKEIDFIHESLKRILPTQ